METKKTLESANFYAICPNCGEAIPFQGADIQYYKPIGTELENTLYSSQEEVKDTGKVIACPYCKAISKSADVQFVINDY